MANTITGRVHEITPVQNIPTKSGSVFTKRELVLDATRYDSITGEKGFESYPVISFTQDKCALLDTLQPGQIVTVSFDLRGNRSEKDGRYYNDVRGYKVELLRQNQQPAQPMQTPTQPIAAAPVPQPMQAEPQQQIPNTPFNIGAQQYVQYQQYPQQPAQQPQPPYPTESNNGNLPF